MCAFTRAETESYFRRPLFGRFWFGLVNGLEWFWRNRPERSYFVAYLCAATMNRQLAKLVFQNAGQVMRLAIRRDPFPRSGH